MRVDRLLAAGPTRSFEFFPPKDEAEERLLRGTLRRLAPLEPSFISVTYRGGRASRERTFELVRRAQGEYGLVAMAHLICVAHTAAELREILDRYASSGVENLMALGGDPPDDPATPRGEYDYAIDLVRLARECGEFSVGVAAHTAGHPRSPSLESDRDHLAAKLALADFAVTQWFFHVDEWVSLVGDLADRGVTKPVLPGVGAITTIAALNRVATTGAVIPDELVERMHQADVAGGAPAVRAAGIAATVELCRALLAAGAPGLHFYTMNRAQVTSEVIAQL